MKCHDFEENIAAYLDGFLDGDLKKAMDEHRAACPECAGLAKAHSFVMKSLDTAEPVKAPSGLAGRILEKIEAETAQAPVFRPASAIDCGTFEGHVAAYVDGLLNKELREAMNEHRAACSSCDRVVSIHDLVLASLNNTEPVLAPQGLKSRILDAVEKYEADTAKAKRYSIFGIRAAAFAAAGSLIAALVPVSKLFTKRIPDIAAGMERINITEESLNTIGALLNAIKAQAVIILLYLQNQIASIRLPEEWLHALSLVTQPLQIPYLSFSIQPYYIAAMAVLAGIAWFYFNEPSFSASSEQSYT